MTTLTRQIAPNHILGPTVKTASDHILSLILDSQRHDADKICDLAHAFSTLNPPPHFGGLELDDEDLVCGETPIPYEPVDVDHVNVRVAYTDSTPPVEATLTPAPATAVATAKKAPAKKAAAKKEAAPAPEPAPTPELPGVLEAPAATDTGEPLSPKEAERFRALVRDEYVKRTKELAKDDPENLRRQAYTAKFTSTVEAAGAKTVSLVEANKLPALLDAIRALQA